MEFDSNVVNLTGKEEEGDSQGGSRREEAKILESCEPHK
jgi:hypothetical protein